MIGKYSKILKRDNIKIKISFNLITWKWNETNKKDIVGNLILENKIESSINVYSNWRFWFFFDEMKGNECMLCKCKCNWFYLFKHYIF